MCISCRFVTTVCRMLKFFFLFHIHVILVYYPKVYINFTSKCKSYSHLSLYFPVISCKPSVQPYLTALLPKDHDLHDIDETSVQNEQKEHKKRKSEHSSPGSSQELPSSQNTDSQQEDAETSDNPYLKPVKMPKKKKKY